MCKMTVSVCTASTHAPRFTWDRFPTRRAQGPTSLSKEPVVADAAVERRGQVAVVRLGEGAQRAHAVIAAVVRTGSAVSNTGLTIRRAA